MPNKKRQKLILPPNKLIGYASILDELVNLLNQSRQFAASSINAVMTATYWKIGQHIVKAEMKGRSRAEYGDQLVDQLAKDLTKRFGRGFGKSNLYQMRSFYLAYQNIFQTVSGKSAVVSGKQILQIASGKFNKETLPFLFQLSWSHYMLLISVKDKKARDFYQIETIRCGWTIRQLKRQIDTLFYERSALSRNKGVMLKKGARSKPEDKLTPEEEIKDPFVLEFLGLKDEYSESDIEEALVCHLETFLLELGRDFAFIGRQRRLRIGDQWYRIDLLFFHRKLRCLVIIDLKIGRFTHADAGQMHLYLNYAAEHWTNSGENPPVGLILCAQKDAAVAHYALENLPNKILAAEYRLKLPNEKEIEKEIERTRKLLEARKSVR